LTLLKIITKFQLDSFNVICYNANSLKHTSSESKDKISGRKKPDHGHGVRESELQVISVQVQQFHCE